MRGLLGVQLSGMLEDRKEAMQMNAGNYQPEPFFGTRIKEAVKTVKDFVGSLRSESLQSDDTSGVDVLSLPLTVIEVRPEQQPVRTSTPAPV